jgi:hypothetical protein
MITPDLRLNKLRVTSGKSTRVIRESVGGGSRRLPIITQRGAVYRKLGYEAKAVEAERRGVALAEGHVQSYPDNARAYVLAIAALYNLGEAFLQARRWRELQDGAGPAP